MRNPSASVESSPASPNPPFELPDAGLAKRVSGAMLALGAALLFFVPVGGVYFLLAGGLGLTIALEPPVAAQPKLSSSTTNQ